MTSSASLLLQHGLREALTGRFELLPCQQWDYEECENAFGFSLDDYLFFGGYPGAAPLREDRFRWLDYMQDSIIAPSVLRDVISLDKVTKPALMEALFSLGCAFSGQEVSYRKMMGQLDDAGNATTIAHYLMLLGDAGLLSGLQKYTGKSLKSGRIKRLDGLDAFHAKHSAAKSLVVGSAEAPLDAFLHGEIPLF